MIGVVRLPFGLYFSCMNTNKNIEIVPPVKVVEWIGDASSGYMKLLDQTLLPNELSYCECHTKEDVRRDIERLAVRGAPAIGVAAAYGMVIALRDLAPDEAANYLEAARPTAVNLAWAARIIAENCMVDGQADPSTALDEAIKIHNEDQGMCLDIGASAAPLIKKYAKGGGVLTHCNAGALATSGIGTATAGMYVANNDGCDFTVYCDETRPLLQGSRLTAWELSQAGINAVVITDNMVASLMSEGSVGLVIVGADRIAANGDAANKIGTHGVAILASHFNIPFYVAAPRSTFDMTLDNGAAIPIEFRGDEEVTCGFGKRTAPEGIGVWSPAFDVTPVELITGIITDKGIIDPLTVDSIRQNVCSGN